MRRHVYRGSSEPEPRATASGGQNVISLGAVAPGVMRECPAWGCDGPPHAFPITYLPPQKQPLHNWPGATSTVAQPPPSSGGTQVVSETQPVPLSPAPSPTVAVPLTQTAPSLPNPGASGWLPNASYQIGQTIVDAAGHVQAVTTQGTSGSAVPAFSDSGGTTGDGSVVWTDQGVGGVNASASSITSWFTEQTLISGIPNWGLLAAVVGAFFLMKGRK